MPNSQTLDKSGTWEGSPGTTLSLQGRIHKCYDASKRGVVNTNTHCHDTQ